MHVRELFDLSGRVAIVTGGSRGLGLEIAEGLAEAGAAVAITGRRRQWLDPAVAGLQAAGAQALGVEADAADAGGVQRTIEETVARFGGVDILINNAGMSWGADSLTYPFDKWEQTVRTNLTGVWLMAQATAPQLIERGGGVILNVSSITGQLGIRPELQDTVSYNASKGGVDALTRDLAVKWARHNIRGNAIAPGYFRTRMTAGLLDNEGSGELARSISPFGRLGQEGELKGVAVFLCSAAASYISGQVLNVDGGATIW
jgi:NAD(P)-dependent dehydrogenase (short-subunit alcohol dehydrogenase family)